MKWTIYELMKQEHQDNSIDVLVSIDSFLEGTDIIRASKIHVTGTFEIMEQEEFVFDLSIKGTLVIPCAITLKEVNYEVDIETEEVFTTFQDEETIQIEGITIDLLPIIWSNILLDKPMRVISDGAYDEVDFENVEFDDDTENAFADLKNYNT